MDGAGGQWSGSPTARSHLEALRDASARLLRGAVPPIVIKMMPGNRPDVHDRFLLVDDRVFLLGSSLGEFGSRGTTLLRLPYPELVRPKLEAAWNSGVELDTKIASLSQGPPSNACSRLRDVQLGLLKWYRSTRGREK